MWRRMRYLILLLLCSCATSTKYKIGECNWHKNVGWSNGLYFKTIDIIKIEDKSYYLSQQLNWSLEHNNPDSKIYAVRSISYTDSSYNKSTVSDGQSGMRVKCPTFEQYHKDKEKMKKLNNI